MNTNEPQEEAPCRHCGKTTSHYHGDCQPDQQVMCYREDITRILIATESTGLLSSKLIDRLKKAIE